MIGEVTLAMTAGVGLGKIGSTIHSYPTQSDVFAKAANAWRKQKLTPTVGKLLRTFFRIFGKPRPAGSLPGPRYGDEDTSPPAGPSDA